MVYLELFITFFKIGLFSFGGGYAMIPLIQTEVLRYDWLSSEQIVQVITISEMTPGPIAVNMATFVGYKTLGLLGGAFATLGVMLPSILFIMVISRFFFTFRDNVMVRAILYGIKPVVIALIISAALFLAQTVFFTEQPTLAVLTEGSIDIWHTLEPANVLMMLCCLFVLIRFRIHPIKLLLGAGVLGIILSLIHTL